MRNLMDYLPEFYLSSTEMCALQAAIQPEIDLIWAARNDLLAQLNPETATWSLNLWESALGIEPLEGQPESSRRNAVKAKIAGRLSGRGAATEAYLRAVIAGLMQGDVTIEERFAEDLVAVHVTSDIRSGPNYDDLPRALRETIPAHLLMECGVKLVARSGFQLHAGFCLRVARRVTGGCAVPALDVALLTDEDGNLLGDELGLRLTEECDPYGV